MPRQKKTDPAAPKAGDAITSIKYPAKRKNIPPAGLEAQGVLQEAPRLRYEYNPHLYEFAFGGMKFRPSGNRHWRTALEGMLRLANANRLAAPSPNSLGYVCYLKDFPVAEFTSVWSDTATGAFADEKVYVVQKERRVAVSIGPEIGNLSVWQVEEVVRTANRRGFDDLVFAAFGFDATTQNAIEQNSHPNEALSGLTSLPFLRPERLGKGETWRVAVKVIDPRGNEGLRVLEVKG